jgi:Amt family ammonium transporter
MPNGLFQGLSLPLAVMLLLRVAHALLIGGTVRSKSSAATAMRLALDLAIAALSLWAVGAVFYPQMAAPAQWISPSHLFGISTTGEGVLTLLPLVVLASGAVHADSAERVRGGALLGLTALLGMFVIPLLVRVEGALDGQARLIVTDRGVGMAAVVGGAAAIVGARKGKFNRDQSANFIPGHHVLLQVVGLLLMLVAWIAIGGNAMNVLLSASAAMLASAAFGRVRFGKVDTGLTLGGTIGGMCAVASAPALTAGLAAAGGDSMAGYAAVLIGALAGVAVPWAVLLIETRFRIDDVLGIGTAHFIGGIIGLPLTGLLSNGTGGERLSALAGNAVVAVIAAVAGAGVAFLVAIVASRSNALRVTEIAEFDGADLSELDLNGYPDFQQNMIKSYHLREM